LLSWNVHALPHFRARARLGRVVDKIAELQPDVVCLQEVWAGHHADKLRCGLAGAYAALAMTHVRNWPRGGLVILIRRASGFRADPPTFVPYTAHASRRRVWEGDGVSGKGVLSVRLHRDGEALSIVNTHLQAQYHRNGRRYSGVRRAQLTQLALRLEQLGANEAVLVAGDLNTSPTESLYAQHVVALGRDLTEPARRQVGGGTHLDRYVSTPSWIDYVLARGLVAQANVGRIENTAPDVPYSDHHGLIVEIVYRVASFGDGNGR